MPKGGKVDCPKQCLIPNFNTSQFVDPKIKTWKYRASLFFTFSRFYVFTFYLSRIFFLKAGLTIELS